MSDVTIIDNIYFKTHSESVSCTVVTYIINRTKERKYPLISKFSYHSIKILKTLSEVILKFVFIYSTICIASKFILIIGPNLIPHTLSFAAYQRIYVQSQLINIKLAEMLCITWISNKRSNEWSFYRLIFRFNSKAFFN